MIKKLLFVFLVLLTPRSFGQKAFPFGVVDSLPSAALNETRVLNIYLPQGYHPDSAKTYPVVYLLDGSAHEDYPHIAGLVQFLNMYGLMPPSIVVGIANVNRYRDFTTPTTVAAEQQQLPMAGGSAAFIRFIKNELQPYIRQHYRCNDQNTIIGQSLGGLVATEILLDEPQLFTQYVIVSPSLWWNKRSLLSRAPQTLKTSKLTGKKIFIAVGNEPGEMTQGAKDLETVLNKNTSGNQVKREYFPQESHATVLHRSVYRAMEWLYPVKK